MSRIWENITKDSFIVDIRLIDKHRWLKAVDYIIKYITNISDACIGMKGVHVISSWGNKKMKKLRMVCKRCGTYFEPLWDDLSVDGFVNVEYTEVDYG